MLSARNSSDTTLVTWERLTAGALAGMTSVFATYPLDLIRTRLSLPDHPHSGIIDCGRTLIRTEGGISALFRGLGATIMGVAPYVGLNFAFYETFKDYFLSSSTSGHHLFVTSEAKNNLLSEHLIKFACGGAAGAISQTITYPLDVLRRKMQVVGINGNNSNNNNYSMRSVIRTMWQSEGGIKAFYRGIIPNYLKVIPAMSVSFVSYEWTKSFIMNL